MSKIRSASKTRWADRCGSTLARLLPSTIQLQVQQADQSGWRIDTRDLYCHRCGSTIGPEAVTERGCPFCINESVAWDRLLRLSAYQDPMTAWILQMKYARAWTWADWMGKQLATLIENLPASDDTSPDQNQNPDQDQDHDRPDHGKTDANHQSEKERQKNTRDHQHIAVCAVPMHWLRRWGRGFNQAQLIAESIAKARAWPTAPILKRTRRTAPQINLTPSQRAHNISGSIAIESVDLSGWEIWLVDDVKTTGSTLNLCARLLRKAGAMTVNVAVAAVADPKHADFQVV